uniref:Uncharacterized protein n=1 Tax=Tetranychus urticae TaxID=32264 RepID=T1KJ31_TETUR
MNIFPNVTSETIISCWCHST